jgi:hypothetical protein
MTAETIVATMPQHAPTVLPTEPLETGKGGEGGDFQITNAGFIAAVFTDQNRIAELEALVEYYRDKSERAEDWLNQILTEIEDRLINEPNAKRLQMSPTITSGTSSF